LYLAVNMSQIKIRVGHTFYEDVIDNAEIKNYLQSMKFRQKL